jgi:hypothetical protein
MVVIGGIVPGFSGYGITRMLEVHDPAIDEAIDALNTTFHAKKVL